MKKVWGNFCATLPFPSVCRENNKKKYKKLLR